MYRARRLSGAALAITMFGALVLALSASAEAKKGEGVPPGIACADLAPLPKTGGIRLGTLFLAGAISVLVVRADF
jgi:hypothetical protein